MIAKVWKVAMAAAIVATWAAVAQAQEKLTFATMTPPQAPLNTGLLRPWTQQVIARAQGALVFDIRDGTTLANFSNIYSRVLDDVVQVGFGITSQMGGNFPLAAVASLPLWDKPEEGAVALWRLYKSGALDEEFKEIVPLMLIPTAQPSLHFNKALRTLDDLRGLKIMVGAKMAGDLIRTLGAVPQPFVLTDIYESLQRGTVDGVAISWQGVGVWKLGEVTSYHVDPTAGTGTGSGVVALFMARKRYDALPAPARKALDESSGESLSRTAAQWWHDDDAKMRARIKTDGKHQIAELSPEQAATWQQKFAPVFADFAKSRPGADKVLDQYKRLLADVRAGR